MLTRTNRLFFRDRLLERGPGGERIKKIRKLGPGGPAQAMSCVMEDY